MLKYAIDVGNRVTIEVFGPDTIGIICCLLNMSPWFQNYKRNYHLLHGDSSMLVCIPIITNIMVVIIGIGKKQVIFGKNVGAANIYIGQKYFLWIFCFQYILFFIG